ncbi:MAG: hypothetical protein PVSMB8_04840 [Vulcanimicrobiaceae bacterium]
MGSFDLDAKGGKELEAFLAEKSVNAVRRAIISAGFRTLGAIQNEIIPALQPHAPIDRRAYVAAWHLEIREDLVELVNSIPHAVLIDKGVRAEHVKVGRIMIDALAAWVLRKGLAGKGASASVTARQIAWAISMTMKKVGIFGRTGMRVGEKALKKFQEYLPDELHRAVRRA